MQHLFAPHPLQMFHSTTDYSAPVSCFGTLLKLYTFWNSPLSSRRLVSAAPYRSPNQNHASYTLAAVCPITKSSTNLSQVMETTLVSTAISGLRRVYIGSGLFVFLILTCLSFLSTLTRMLTTTALYRSSFEWFEICSWKPISKGLPSSSVKLMHKVSVYVLFLCAHAAHFQFSI